VIFQIFIFNDLNKLLNITDVDILLKKYIKLFDNKI